MWMRFVGFWVLVSFILLIIFSCIIGRPVLQLYFRRCCEEDIENDHIIFENLDNNFLRERLISNPDIILVNEDDYLIADIVSKQPFDDKNYVKDSKVDATFEPVVFVNVHDIASRYKDDISQSQEEKGNVSDEHTKPNRLQNELIDDYDDTSKQTDETKQSKEDGENITLNNQSKKTENNSIKANKVAEFELDQMEKLDIIEKNNEVDSNEDEDSKVEDNEVLLYPEFTTEGKIRKETTVIR